MPHYSMPVLSYHNLGWREVNCFSKNQLNDRLTDCAGMLYVHANSQV